MMTFGRNIVMLLIFALVIALLSGCSGDKTAAAPSASPATSTGVTAAPPASTTPSPGASAVTAAPSMTEPAYASAMTDELLKAIDAGDYQACIKNLDEATVKATTETVFNRLRSLFQAKIGAYVSKELVKVETPQQYVRVTYKAEYTDEPDGVTVVMVFLESEDKVVIAGYWFDSPKLRQT